MFNEVKKKLAIATILLGTIFYPDYTNSQAMNNPVSVEEKQRDIQVIKDYLRCFNKERAKRWASVNFREPVMYLVDPIRNCSNLILQKNEYPEEGKEAEKEYTYGEKNIDQWLVETEICLYVGISDRSINGIFLKELELDHQTNKDLEIELTVENLAKVINQEAEFELKGVGTKYLKNGLEARSYILKKKSNSLVDMAKDWGNYPCMFSIIKRGDQRKVIPVPPRYFK